MVPSVFIVESELSEPVGAAVSLPLLGVVLGDAPGLGDVPALGEASVVGDALVLGEVPAFGGVPAFGDMPVPGEALVLGDGLVLELLGGVVVVESGGMFVAFGDGCGRVPCAVVVELELSVVDWA